MINGLEGYRGLESSCYKLPLCTPKMFCSIIYINYLTLQKEKYYLFNILKSFKKVLWRVLGQLGRVVDS